VNEIRSLTGLRGVAACLVLLYHFTLAHRSSGIIWSAVHHGYIWVDLFFVLSGFVLSVSHKEFSVGSITRTAYWNYLILRFARLYPLYLFCSVIALVFGLYFPNYEPSAVGTISNILMVQAWGIHDSIVTPGWSVSTEWMASLLFPLFSLFISKQPRNSTLGLILLMCGMIFALAVMPTPYRSTGPLDLSDGRSFLPLVRCLSGFVIGVGAHSMARDETIVRYLSGQYSTILIVMGLLFLMPFTISDVILVPIFACLVVSLYLRKSVISEILGHAIFWRLGTLSYSIYLLHTLFLGKKSEQINQIFSSSFGYVGLKFSFPLVDSIEFLMVIALSAITYSLIERPGRAFIRRALQPTKTSTVDPHWLDKSTQRPSD
jgi:peptidoglycan/LPS O-acetylase OafA/YrhL